MFTLHNSRLSVQVLDPVEDKKLLGSRYCTGGYIFRIRDADGNDLLSGPRYGQPEFDVFDGQGAPEVFVTAPGGDTAPVGGEVLVIGVGRVMRSSAAVPFHVRDNPAVNEFARWIIDAADDRIVMTTVHSFQGRHIALTRTVRLCGGTVESVTRLENRCGAALPVRWFAHPFFPLTENLQACAFSFPVVMPDNPGYFIDATGFVTMKKDYPWDRGLFLRLGGCAGRGRLRVRQSHPLLGEIRAECGFAPADLAIWANSRSFSFEAFYEKMLREDEAAEWGISYLLQ